MHKRSYILSTVGAARHRLMIRLFGNTIALKVNLLYTAYVRIIKLAVFLGLAERPTLSAVGRREAATLNSRGFTKLFSVLPIADVNMISAKVDTLFASPYLTVRTLEDGGLLRLKSCLSEVPELERYIFSPKIQEVLQSYFGCGYKVYNCDVYRTIPEKSENPEEEFGSLKWHFDNSPDALVKIMVYLTNTDVNTGALTLIDKTKSLDLKRRGFWDRNHAQQFQNEIEECAVALEAPAGTTLLFSTHHCIHKATLPKARYRDVAVFLVQPAPYQQRAFTAEQREKLSHSYGYCTNPFFGTPLRYGNE